MPLSTVTSRRFAAEDLVASPIAAILMDAAKNPGISLESKDVSRVAAGVVEAVAPIVVHATNNEPWYQSRVTWGVIVAGVCTIAKPLIGELPVTAEQTADIVSALTTAGQAIGFGLTLYGRWRARRPIGS
ncbi:hypothetical protein [Aureimonas ureilytica]|uniref:hypothetical protein n=1 Tax=Aureimonas ureilytica TaxID=401562 RepID=UPI000734136E|nr:hypothetical protein [Aureimonas ureilytica]